MKAYGSLFNLLVRGQNPRYKSVLKREATAKNDGTSQSEAEPISRNNQNYVGNDNPSHGLGENEQNESPNRIQPWNWAIGWKTPTFMVSIYILALLIAIAHLVFFHFLNGKREDDPNASTPSQTYVTAASTIMSNVFAICIKAVLGAIFTQYLWRLVRLSPLKVMTLESLFTLRTDPLSLLSLSVLRKGWLLVMIAALIWVTSIAASFPPSAMTVTTTLYQNSDMMGGIPSLNVSSTWNGDTQALQKNSFATFEVGTSDDGFGNGGFAAFLSTGLSSSLKPSLQDLAVNTMINGEITTMTSPCGINCSYTLEFDGPYLSCTNNSVNMSLAYPSGSDPNFTLPLVFTANWTILPNQSNEHNALATGHLDFVVLYADYFGENESSENSTNLLNYTVQTTSCYPRRAQYQLHQSFENGGQASVVTIGSVFDLVPLPAYVTPPPGVNNETWLYNSNGSWGDQADNYLRDANIMSLIQTMASPLLGSYSAGGFSSDPPGSSVTVEDGFMWGSAFWTVPNDLDGARNGTIAPSTRLFNLYSNNSLYQPASLEQKSLFTVTESVLNSLLMNFTISTIPAFNLWPTSTNVTTDQLGTKYTFSRPLNLLLPYFLTLAIVLVLLLVGLWALRMNGVSATDGGFLQLLMTTRGSEALDRAARDGCLGGEENIPREMRELEVMFGEFIERGGTSGVMAESLRKRNFAEPSSRQEIHDPIDTNGNSIEVEERTAKIGNLVEDAEYTRQRTPLAGFGTRDEVVPLVVRRRHGTLE